MAIGRPITLTDNVASKIISATATASQTAFTVTGGYRINALTVYRNGVCLVDGSDYTAIDGSIVTLTTGASASDTLEFHIFDDFRVSDAILNNSSNQTIDGDLTINGDLTVTGILTGAQIGINSAGTTVGTAKTLNFIGAGNTFRDNGDGIIDILDIVIIHDPKVTASKCFGNCQRHLRLGLDDQSSHLKNSSLHFLLYCNS